MKKSGMIKALCACTMLLVPVVSHAQTEGKVCDKNYQMCSELGLTEEQKVKLKELHQEIKALRTENFKNARSIRMKIRDELIKESPSASQLDLYAAELGEVHKLISKQHNDHLLKVKVVLSAEQFSKIVNKGTDGCGKFRMKAGKGKHQKAPHKKCCMENKENCKFNNTVE